MPPVALVCFSKRSAPETPIYRNMREDFETQRARHGKLIAMRVNEAHTYQSDFLGDALYASFIAREEMAVQGIDRWQTSIAPEAFAGAVERAVEGRLLYEGHNAETGFREMVRASPNRVARVTFYSGSVCATVAAKAHEDVRALAVALREQLPQAQAIDQTVPIHFWALGPNGPLQFSRSISVPTWEEIRVNYANATQARLEHLMNDFTASKGGQLILWHGEPGTGKTFALRALSWAWREWCDVHYISNPEVFFGEHSSYMLQILTAGSESDRWRILLLEDSGELLATDAKERTGQGLSRLLNVVDGLIGQGLRILVLITTNDEMRKLHPAVSRPGRCAATVDFEKLSAAEIEHWADARGVIVNKSKPQTVAELYGQAEGYLQSPESVPVGFGTG